jgi:hypothetical protein
LAWVIGIKQAQMIQPDRDGKEAIPPQRRVVIDLPASAIAGTVRRGPMVFLPTHTGAGPCGTHARYPYPGPLVARNAHWGRSPIAWSIKHLIEPLREYYAEKNKERDPHSRAGIRIGAKSGGGNGRCELW